MVSSLTARPPIILGLLTNFLYFVFEVGFSIFLFHIWRTSTPIVTRCQHQYQLVYYAPASKAFKHPQVIQPLQQKQTLATAIIPFCLLECRHTPAEE